MATPDFFNSDAFNMQSLTLGINRFPTMYGRLAPYFPERGVVTRSVFVEEQNGVLNLLQSRPPGSPGSLGTQGKRKVRSFIVPHVPHDDVVLPEEVQGVREFASENSLKTVASMVAQKLQTMSYKHDITREWHRVGAIRGQILDADGSVIYDLFSEFGITQQVMGFALTTGSTEVISKVLNLKRYMETNAKGEVMSGIRVFCSSTFYDAFTTHASVKEAFKYYTQQQKLSGDYRTGFEYGGVVFEEYNGSATDASGTVRQFIPNDEAYAIPEGTITTFALYNAPADFNETVNTIGLPKYAKQEGRKFGRGWDLHTQSNPLALCARPELLVKLTKV